MIHSKWKSASTGLWRIEHLLARGISQGFLQHVVVIEAIVGVRHPAKLQSCTFPPYEGTASYTGTSAKGGQQLCSMIWWAVHHSPSRSRCSGRPSLGCKVCCPPISTDAADAGKRACGDRVQPLRTRSEWQNVLVKCVYTGPRSHVVRPEQGIDKLTRRVLAPRKSGKERQTHSG